MGAYLRVKDEDEQVWLLQEGDPLWKKLTLLREYGYEMYQLILPRELAVQLRVNKPNYNRIAALIEDEVHLDVIGKQLLLEDIRNILGNP